MSDVTSIIDRLPQLSAPQQQLLSAIYAAFRELGAWPQFQYLDKLLDRAGMDFQQVADSMPAGLSESLPGRVLALGDTVNLTLAGLAVVPEADDDLTLFITAVIAAAASEERFEPAVAGPPALAQLSSKELESLSGGGQRDVLRLYHLLQREPWFGGGGIGPDGWTCGISREIRKFRTVSTFPDYFIRRSELFPQWPGSRPLDRPHEPPRQLIASAGVGRRPFATLAAPSSGASQPIFAGPLAPAHRTVLIRRVAESIADASWPEVRALLERYGLAADPEERARFGYCESAVRASSDELLIRLLAEVGLSDLLSNWTEELLNPWKPSAFRLFCSHVSEDQGRVAQLASALDVYGVSAFVAHRDIRPQTEWASAIEFSLKSADALIAIIGDGFERSYWCNQEVGWALGRGILTASIRFAADPPGFVSRFQAIPSIDEVQPQARLVFELLAREGKTAERMVTAIVSRLEGGSTYSEANGLLPVVATCPFWTVANQARLEDAIRDNQTLQGSYALPKALDTIRRASGWIPSTDISELVERVRGTIPSYWQS